MTCFSLFRCVIARFNSKILFPISKMFHRMKCRANDLCLRRMGLHRFLVRAVSSNGFFTSRNRENHSMWCFERNRWKYLVNLQKRFLQDGRTKVKKSLNTLSMTRSLFMFFFLFSGGGEARGQGGRGSRAGRLVFS